MDKRLLIILNPHSGKGKIKTKILDIIDIFIKDGWNPYVYITQGANDAFEFVKEKGFEFDRVVASGGDGTFNEVICGIMSIPTENRPEIGYIPSGTVNDFASNMKMSKNMLKAAENIVKGSPFKCDIGQFNEKNFVYVAAFGAFTNVSYETSQQSKNILGQLAYFLEGIKQLYALPSHKIKIECNGESFEEEVLLGMVSNSNHIAGIKTEKALKAELNDGLFEVLLVKSPKTLAEMRDLSWHLIMQDFNTDAIKVFRTENIRISSDEQIQWTLDGEFGGAVENADISVKKEAVTLII